MSSPRFDPPPDSRPDDTAWPQLTWPVPPEATLVGGTVVLRRADPERDAAALSDALDDDRVWAHVRGRPATAFDWTATLQQRFRDDWLPWVVTLRQAGYGRPAGAVIGTSSYLEVSAVDARLEIGATMYAPDVWGSKVNPETKLLLLSYAFDELRAGRVQLKTDVRNQRSLQAIARLGARYEGVLRRYQRRSDMTVRDTVVFSIIAEQWPEVRGGLQARLGSHGQAP